MKTDYIIKVIHDKKNIWRVGYASNVSNLEKMNKDFSEIGYVASSVSPAKRNTNVLPYEIHLTLRDYQVSYEQFKRDCADIGVKSLLIELQNNNTETMQTDVMTKWAAQCTIEEAVNTAEAFRVNFIAKGYEVLRVKIETVPWHPISPKKDGELCFESQYFECHAQVLIHNNNSSSRRFREVMVKVPEVHVSRNPLKIKDDGSYIQMVTIRKNCDMFMFRLLCEDAFHVMKMHGFTPNKVEHEFCIFDSNSTHDKEWISK